jgi:protein-S-isoprenylcysteine O-methyltransferase Ste14
MGSAIAFGQLRHLLAIPLTMLGWWIKIRQEEQLLGQEFGEQYAAYRREVRGAIIPYIL